MWETKGHDYVVPVQKRLPQKDLPGFISNRSQISTTCFQLNEWV